MDLTKENKEFIDGLDLYRLLKHNRFAPAGDPWFQGETGDYWLKRLNEKRDASPGEYVAASKMIGWS